MKGPSAAVSSTVPHPAQKRVAPRGQAFSVSPAPMACHHHAAAGADAQPRGKDDSAMGHRMLMEARPTSPMLWPMKKPSTMIKIPSEAGMHGGDDVAVKLLVRRFGMQKTTPFPYRRSSVWPTRYIVSKSGVDCTGVFIEKQ